MELLKNIQFVLLYFQVPNIWLIPDKSNLI